MNSTIEKFGYPDTLVAEYGHWVVMLRQKQITAGCLILACKEEATAFPNLSPEAFSELKVAMGDIENNLRAFVQFEKMNYVVLMMVDPHVHFHVIPRYSGTRRLGSHEIPDPGWPRHPDFQAIANVPDADLSSIGMHLRREWKRA